VPKEGNLSVALNAFSKLIDINRDGLSDSIVSTGDGKKFENDGGSPYNDAGNTVFLNTGKGFVRDPNWDMPYYKLRDDVESPPQDNFYPLYHTYGWACENSTFIDLNKDGLVDYISTCDSSFFGDDGGSPYNDAQNTVFLNTGKGFVRDPNWDMPHEDNSPIILSIFSRLVDINKDGLVDFVNARDGVFQNDGGSPYNDSKNTVFLNTGKGFVRDPNWDMPYGISKGLIWGCRLNNLVDVNSDGLPDFVPIGNNSQFIEDGGSSFNDVKNTVFLNTGKDFVRDPNWDMPYFINSDKDIYDFYEPESIFTDLNKDGLVDFLITSYSYDNDVEKNYGIFKNDGGSLYNDATKTVFINTYKK